MYDVIVIGARCAGAPTAMLLARQGHRVLLVDRATFPSDTMSSHFVHPTGVACLKRWGLLDRLQASACPPISRWYFDLGPFMLAGSPPPVDGVAVAYAPRRHVLDTLLVDAAVEAGAELWQGFTVQALSMDGDRVTGVRGRTADGRAVAETARIVVGADGMRSLVARTVRAAEYHARPALTCAYYSYWRGVPIEGAEGYLREGLTIFAFPTNDDLTVVYFTWPISQFQRVRTDVHRHFLEAVALAPPLAERVRHGRQEGQFAGTADLPNYLRMPYGPGWALVGDAGFHKDPYLAQGISDALRDAELLATAVGAGLDADRALPTRGDGKATPGSRPLEQALAGYERLRNAAALPGYELNCQLASLAPPPPEMQQLFAALRGHQAATDRFFGALLGTVPIPEFFAPEHLRQVIEEGMAAQAAPVA